MTATFQTLNDFFGFLRSRKAQSTDEITHISFGIPWGSFCIKETDVPEFMAKYCEVVGKYDLSIIERPKYISQLILDIDFKSTTAIRMYTLTHIKKLIDLVNLTVRVYFKVTDDQLTCYVTEKDSPTVVAGKETKDGFHIMWPFLPMTPDMRYYIISRAVAYVNESDVFNDIPYTNRITDVFDTSIVEKNGWVMYGSKKNNGPKYNLTHIFLHNLVEENINIATGELVKRLSVRKVFEKPIENSVVYPMEQMDYKPVKSTKSAKLTKVAYPVDSPIPNEEMARKLVPLLSYTRASDYHRWMEIGWTLFNISENLLDSFHEFSRKNTSKYSAQECNNVWKKMHKGQYSIATLHWCAEKDSPDEYARLFQKGVMNKRIKHINTTGYPECDAVFLFAILVNVSALLCLIYFTQ